MNTTLNAIRTLPVIRRGFNLLSNELPKDLLYHTAQHAEDVLNDALLFGTQDSLSERELELLAIAAVFHDAGFIERVQQNESIGADYAISAMKEEGGYSEEECEAVRTMILDTEIKPSPSGRTQLTPRTKLSKYLCDADLGSFGRSDFFEVAERVRVEEGHHDVDLFHQQLLKFLNNHTWFSPAAQRLRGAAKENNIKALIARMAQR